MGTQILWTDEVVGYKVTELSVGRKSIQLRVGN